MVVSGLAIAFPSAGQAATVESDRYTVIVQAQAGEVNDVRVSYDNDLLAVLVADAGALLSAGVGCISVTPNEVRCETPSSQTLTRVYLGDQDDALAAHGLCPDGVEPGAYCGVEALGESGDDHLVGSEGVDRLRGGQGKDVLEGREGEMCVYAGHGEWYCEWDELFGGPDDDVLLGGVGEDHLYGEAGADVLSGGPGSDTASYWTRRTGVSVTIDNRANDGSPGEGDDVRLSTEHVIGGFGADMLVGNDRSNDLIGGSGRDRLVGRSGDDQLFGQLGPDELLGGGGDDVLDPGLGHDRARGGTGDDAFRAKDGVRDFLDGGAGYDRARVDLTLDHVERMQAIRG